jgi:hypothetical protein
LQIKDILAIGKIIKKVDLVFNTMVMEINMKGAGKKVKELVRVHIGFMKEKISKIREINKLECDVSTLVIG